MTAREVAERVGLSPDTILRYYRDGQDPGPADAGADPAGAVPVERGRGGVRRDRRPGGRRGATRVDGSLGGRRRERAARTDLPHGRAGCGRSAIATRSAGGRSRRASARKGEAREALDEELRRVRLGPLYRPNVDAARALRRVPGAVRRGAVDGGVPEGQHEARRWSASATSGSASCGSTRSRRGGASLPEGKRYRSHRALRQVLAGGGAVEVDRGQPGGAGEEPGAEAGRDRSVRVAGTRSTRSPPSSTRSAGALVDVPGGHGRAAGGGVRRRVARRRPRARACSRCGARTRRAG